MLRGGLRGGLRGRCAALIAIFTALVACDAPSPPRASPLVTQLDSVELAIPDTMPFLNGRTQAVLSDGSILLDFRSFVLRFSPTGALIGTLGTSGAGPGEFARLSAVMVLPGDTLIAGVDVQRQRIVVLRAADGSLQREVPMPFRFFAGQQWRIRGDTVFMPVTLDAQPFVRWVLATDAIDRFGAAPTLLEQSTVAYSRGGEPSLAPHGDGWLALMPADERLFVLNAAGRVQSAIALPRQQRRGVPSDLLAQTAALTAESNSFLASLSLGVTQLSDGRYLVVHADSDFEQVGNQVEYMNTTYWASVVSADLTRACVDEPIRFPSVDLSRAVFHGDTLWLLGRTVDNDGTVRATQRRFVVSAQGCEWVPLTSEALSP